MARGESSLGLRQAWCARACDTRLLKITKGRDLPDVVFGEHFITLYAKVMHQDRLQWVLQGYRCKHCEKIAGTHPEVSVRHLLVCSKLNKRKRNSKGE